MDICANCESAGLPGNLDSADGGHNSSHILIKVKMFAVLIYFEELRTCGFRFPTLLRQQRLVFLSKLFANTNNHLF